MKGVESYRKIQNELLEYNLKTDNPFLFKIKDGVTIMRSLKALDLILTKNVDIYALKKCEILEDYNSKDEDNENLTQKEFELLKWCLK